MFRNYLAAALRNLARNKLYAGVTIAGLAIGFAAAMLIGLYVRDEFSYDRFIPGHERIYRVSGTLVFAGAKPIRSDTTPMMLAKPLREDFPQIERVARLSPSYFPPSVRRADFAAAEQNFYWADPGFFQVIPLPAVAGDLATALDAPDSLVLTRAMARKYFGQDAPLGQVLQVNGQPMRITAVIRDLPSNTHLLADFFASTRAAISPVSQYEAINGPLTNTLATYIRLRPGVQVDSLTPRLPTFLEQRLPFSAAAGPPGVLKRELQLVPLADIHMRPSDQGAFKPAVDRSVVVAIAVIGGLIVLVAGINFVTLMTARAARRAVEVGVRKAAGASRRDLFIQFMGEAFVYVLLSGLLAVALAELLLPAFNAFLQRRIVFGYLTDPWLAAAILAVLLLTGLLAGAWPALVLSAFRPAAVLKGGPAPVAGGGRLRQGLVIAQFAVLIALTLGAVTIARQTLFALNEGMRVDTDRVELIFTRPCSEALRDVARSVEGVKAAACVSAGALNMADDRNSVTYEGRDTLMTMTGVDFDFLELFGVKPLAGRTFDRSRPADGALDSPDRLPPVVINQTALRNMGFETPEEAIGKTVLWRGIWDETDRQPTPVTLPLRASEIIGVVPDFTFGSMQNPIGATLYSIARNAPPMSIGLAIKLDGKQVPETLAAIDKAWKRIGQGEPMLRASVNFYMLRLYVETIIQGVTIAVAAVIALTVAALGLFALSAFTTERRTKEIGVRKAMGASSGDILKLLLWEFTKPVLWANLIAWPVAWLVLNWWLSSFAYRVDIAPWTFAAAGAGALAIALATVLVHALSVARSKPVAALRYE